MKSNSILSDFGVHIGSKTPDIVLSIGLSSLISIQTLFWQTNYIVRLLKDFWNEAEKELDLFRLVTFTMNCVQDIDTKQYIMLHNRLSPCNFTLGQKICNCSIVNWPNILNYKKYGKTKVELNSKFPIKVNLKQWLFHQTCKQYKTTNCFELKCKLGNRIKTKYMYSNWLAQRIWCNHPKVYCLSLNQNLRLKSCKNEIHTKNW